MSNLSRFFPADLTRPTHVPSTPNYVFNGIPTLLKWSKRKAGGNRRKNEEMTLEWNEATTKSCLCHSKNENRTSKYCVHDFALLPQECLLTEEEMILNSYPLPCNTTEEEYRVIGDKKCHTAGEIPKMYAVDCEMCITTHGMELTRVSVVNDSLEVVYDEYVKPHHEILDYLTRFSGVTEEKLSCVETRLETVRHDLFELFNSDTILIGHSMENDLRALKLIHYRVVDTAILYSCFRGEQQYKRSLKSLAAEWLKETIQMTDHDSNEDARTAMKLALLKFKYGHRLGSQQENLCEYLSKNGKRTVLVDDACRCKRYAGSHTDCHGEASDEQLTKKMVGAIKGGQYDFLYVRLRALQKYYEGPECESAPPEFQAEKKVCEEMDEYVGEILSVIPKRTLAIVTGAHGNLHHMRRLLDEKNRGEGWSPEDEERLQQQIQTAKTTVSFFKVTNNRNLAAMDS
ncbi:uncharacterized protein LOC126317084 isoform X2 [Schistocerca gregaria]|nr:uncharacterized protein LOC126317084 isoform X2 [Schistocerca gregaria]